MAVEGVERLLLLLVLPLLLPLRLSLLLGPRLGPVLARYQDDDFAGLEAVSGCAPDVSVVSAVWTRIRASRHLRLIS